MIHDLPSSDTSLHTGMLEIARMSAGNLGRGTIEGIDGCCASVVHREDGTVSLLTGNDLHQAVAILKTADARVYALAILTECDSADALQRTF